MNKLHGWWKFYWNGFRTVAKDSSESEEDDARSESEEEPGAKEDTAPAAASFVTIDGHHPVNV